MSKREGYSIGEFSREQVQRNERSNITMKLDYLNLKRMLALVTVCTKEKIY